MRRLAYLLMLASGCSSTPHPCAGQSGVCITARIEGNATGLTQLRFNVLGGMPLTTTTPTTAGSPFSLPVLVGLLLPADRVDGSFDILAEGLAGADTIAGDTQSVITSNKRGTVTFTLDSGTAPDLATPIEADMAEPRDLTAPPIVVTAQPLLGRELEPLTINVYGVDPINQPFTVSIGDQPDGGVSGSDGGSATLTWIPDFTEAGMHTINGIVSAKDPARNVTVPFVVSIANAADQVFPLNPADTASLGLPPTDAVGDFDKDGFADLASCSTNGAGVYTVNLLYGGPGGFPNSMPFPAARTATYTCNQTASMAAVRLPCTGADMDGDGFFDVLISDPRANGGTGMIFIMWGVARATATTTCMPAMAAANLMPNEALGGTPVFVGRYSSTVAGRFDFATQTFPGASGDNIYIFTGKTSRPATAPFTAPEVHVAPSPSPQICGQGSRSVRGFGDIENNSQDELLVWDKNIGSPDAAACSSTGGGLYVIKSGGGDLALARPASSGSGNSSWGSASALCDVDGDGNADIVVADQQPDGKAWIFYSAGGATPFATTGAPAALDVATRFAGVSASPATHLYSDVRCFKNFLPGSVWTTLLVDPGNVSDPARVDIPMATRTPTVARQLPRPAADKGFGISYAGFGDFNNDGKNDVVVGAPMGRYWAIFGH